MPGKEAEGLATKDAVTDSVPRCVVPHILKPLYQAAEKKLWLYYVTKNIIIY